MNRTTLLARQNIVASGKGPRVVYAGTDTTGIGMIGIPSRPSRRSLAGGALSGIAASAASQPALAASVIIGGAAPVLAIPSLRGPKGLGSIDTSTLAGDVPAAIFADGYWQRGDGGGGRLY